MSEETMERRSLKSKVGDRICTPPWRTLSQCRPVVSYASMLCPSGAQTHTRYIALERGIKGTQRLRGRRRYMHASLRAWKGKKRIVYDSVTFYPQYAPSMRAT
jgi:hypothetical protein